MEYYEKRSLLSLPILLAVYGSMYYDIYVYLVTRSGDPNNLNFWGNIFLELFLCLIFVYVILLNLFNYIHKRKTGEGKPSVTDERDRAIEYQAIHVAYYVLAAGVFAGLLTTLWVETLSPMFIVIMTAFLLTGVSADAVRVAAYRKNR